MQSVLGGELTFMRANRKHEARLQVLWIPIYFTMGSLLQVGQLLRGKASTYIINKQLHESIWLATYEISTSMYSVLGVPD
jgi:hypothetical protein